jgi:putative transposase
LISDLCGLFGVTRQAYYKHDEQAIIDKAAKISFAIQFVHEVRGKDPGIGGMKLWYMYRNEFGCVNTLGRDCFEDMIDENGLKVRIRVRRPRTTDSTHGLPTYPNIIRDFIPTAPDQLWVSDITYMEIWKGNGHHTFCYLSLILDAYTEEIVGYRVGDTLEPKYSMEALEMALKRIEGKHVNLIHHSDRGVQYASTDYVRLLKKNNIRISMTESGDPKDNAQAERINNTMKNELLKGKIFYSIGDVRQSVTKAVVFYNTERPHMSIDMMTPSEAALCTGELVKHWKSYREIAIKAKLAQGPSDIAENSLPLPMEGASLRATPSSRSLPALPPE